MSEADPHTPEQPPFVGVEEIQSAAFELVDVRATLKYKAAVTGRADQGAVAALDALLHHLVTQYEAVSGTSSTDYVSDVRDAPTVTDTSIDMTTSREAELNTGQAQAATEASPATNESQGLTDKAPGEPVTEPILSEPESTSGATEEAVESVPVADALDLIGTGQDFVGRVITDGIDVESVSEASTPIEPPAASGTEGLEDPVQTDSIIQPPEGAQVIRSLEAIEPLDDLRFQMPLEIIVPAPEGKRRINLRYLTPDQAKLCGVLSELPGSMLEHRVAQELFNEGEVADFLIALSNPNSPAHIMHGYINSIKDPTDRRATLIYLRAPDTWVEREGIDHVDSATPIGISRDPEVEAERAFYLVDGKLNVEGREIPMKDFNHKERYVLAKMADQMGRVWRTAEAEELATPFLATPSARKAFINRLIHKLEGYEGELRDVLYILQDPRPYVMNEGVRGTVLLFATSDSDAEDYLNLFLLEHGFDERQDLIKGGDSQGAPVVPEFRDGVWHFPDEKLTDWGVHIKQNRLVLVTGGKDHDLTGERAIIGAFKILVEKKLTLNGQQLITALASEYPGIVTNTNKKKGQLLINKMKELFKHHRRGVHISDEKDPQITIHKKSL